MSISGDFWRGKRVLVTGHTGFAGSWLTATLSSLGAQVTGIALPAFSPSLFEQIIPQAKISSHFADICDFPALKTQVDAAKPEIAFHLAAESLVRRAYATPAETFATNVLGTVHVLESLRLLPECRAVLLWTTDKVYENHEVAGAFHEEDRLGGIEPYGASKACAEMAAQSYYQSYFAPKEKGIATLRAGNLFGGGDFSPERLVPDLVRACLEGKDLLLRHPHSTRPWQFVMEAVRVSLLLAEKLYNEPAAYSEPWNAGPVAGASLSVREFAQVLLASWPESKVKIEASVQENAPYEAKNLAIDSTKLRARLGWKPAWPLEKSIAATAQWYRAYAAGQDTAALTFAQIEEFLHG